MYKDNPNAPEIRFIRKNGRVIPIIQGKKKLKAASMIENRLGEMHEEIKQATQGKREVGFDEHGNAVRNFATRSTFPGWYSGQGFKNKEHFYKTLGKSHTQKHLDLVKQATRDLSDGYESPYGRVPADMKFRVITRQSFDNTNIIFRNIEGKVRPLRIKKDDEVPF